MTAYDKRIREHLIKKLHPRNFTAMSGKMSAIVAYILNVKWTVPWLASLAVTSDGFVIVTPATRNGRQHDEMLADVGDLNRNVRNLLRAANLDLAEVRLFRQLYKERVGSEYRDSD